MSADVPDEVLGPQIDTPALLSLGRSSPCSHDGSAPTLLDVLTAANNVEMHGFTSHLSQEQLDALIAFMHSIKR